MTSSSGLPGPAVAATRLAATLLTASLLYLLLRNLLFHGVPFSYDPTTYTRSLWGAAHGSFFNTVVSAPTFGIHGQFVLLLMAPLAWLTPPAGALALFQAAAFGALIWLVSGEIDRVLAQARFGLAPRLAGVVSSALLLIACPLVMNPFLFDVRPDLIAVPLLTAAGVRAVRRGGFDHVSIGLLLSSMFVREDFAVVAAAALIFAPSSREAGLASFRTRIVAAAAAIAYLAFYLFVIRRLLGGSGLVQGFNRVGANLFKPGADTVGEYPASVLVRYKLEIFFVAIGSLGGLPVLGRRWLWMAAPGLAILVGMSRLEPWVLNTHYAMFAAPGMIVAAVAGFRKWIAADVPRARRIVLAGALAAMAFFFGSALPGGGHYLRGHFWLARSDPRESAAADRLEHWRRIIGRIPQDQGLVVPFVLGPPFAGRPIVATTEGLSVDLMRQGRAPRGVEWVALFPGSWRGYGRLLIQRGEFHTAAVVPGEMVVLTNRPGATLSPR